MSTCLPAGQGAELLAARERAFWLVKAAGADDLIDMVVPRDKIPDYLRRVQEIADRHESRVFGCGHAGDGNIHFSVYQRDEVRRSALLRAIFEVGLGLGGAISGEHGIGRAKKAHYEALEDPGKLALQRRIKEAFDPMGILNPGCHLRPRLNPHRRPLVITGDCLRSPPTWRAALHFGAHVVCTTQGSAALGRDRRGTQDEANVGER